MSPPTRGSGACFPPPSGVPIPARPIDRGNRVYPPSLGYWRPRANYPHKVIRAGDLGISVVPVVSVSYIRVSLWVSLPLPTVSDRGLTCTATWGSGYSFTPHWASLSPHGLRPGGLGCNCRARGVVVLWSLGTRYTPSGVPIPSRPYGRGDSGVAAEPGVLVSQ